MPTCGMSTGPDFEFNALGVGGARPAEARPLSGPRAMTSGLGVAFLIAGVNDPAELKPGVGFQIILDLFEERAGDRFTKLLGATDGSAARLIFLMRADSGLKVLDEAYRMVALTKKGLAGAWYERTMGNLKAPPIVPPEAPQFKLQARAPGRHGVSLMVFRYLKGVEYLGSARLAITVAEPA